MKSLASALGPLCALVLVGCTRDRAQAEPVPTYREDVAPIALRACAPCHTGDTAAAGWRATTYVDAIACVAPSGRAAVLPTNASAPVLVALGDATHRGVVTHSELQVFTRWIAGGAPDVREGVHPRGIENPRSSAFHGADLRAKKYAPMRDAADEQACGRCHEGVASRPAGITLSAPGATPCTSCHTEPQGPLACPTCHGDGKRDFPPRDRCFFPAESGAHRAHVEPTATHATGFDCATCHPVPEAKVFGGRHANGAVDVIFDTTRVAAGATYDAATATCTVSCHNRGGARPLPSWNDRAPVGCADCHGSPPSAHYPGVCSSCHREANATGTALTKGFLHMNGLVDLGDGTNACGSCHGKGDDPWPTTNAHAAHKSPTLASPFACASCHPTPATIKDTGHLDGVAQIAFGEHALDRNATPSWDGMRCSGVACHGANLTDPSALPAWNDASGAARECTACHGAPPAQHTGSSACGRSECHGGEVTTLAGKLGITPFGRMLHVNGSIDDNR